MHTDNLVHCTRDAGSVYVLDGESIYGDNGASVKGMLPPAYEDLPARVRLRLERELPPLPPLPPLSLTTSLSGAAAAAAAPEQASTTAPSSQADCTAAIDGNH